MYLDKTETLQKDKNSPITAIRFDSDTNQLTIYFDNDSTLITEALQKNNIEYLLEASNNVIIVSNHFIPVAFLLRKYLPQNVFEAILKRDPSKEQWGRHLNQILKIPGCFNELLKRCKNTTPATKQSHPTFFNNTPPTMAPDMSTPNAPECYLRFSTIMSNCLYGGDLVKSGYYSHGNVKFKKDVQDSGHFVTFPSGIQCKAMAFLLALRFFANWRSKNSPPQFIIYEGGAGNGNLAYEFLFLVRKLATEQKVPGWLEFWTALKYRIAEISPALIQVQSKLNQIYIEAGKLKIIEADATVYSFTEEKIDEFLGNELVDAFPYDEFVIPQDGSLKAVVQIPYVLKKDCDAKLISELEKKSQDYQIQFHGFFSHCYLELDKVLIIDPKILSSNQTLHDKVQFSAAYLDVKKIPELRPYLRFESMLKAMLRRGDISSYINLGVLDFISNLRGRADEIILIDYGKATREMSSNKIALYPQQSVAHLLNKGGFGDWGKYDMTADVDFTNLFNLLADHYKFFQYGQQSVLLGAIRGELFDQVLGALAISKEPYFFELLKSLQALFEINAHHIDQLEQHEHPLNYILVHHLNNLDNSRNFKGLICSEPGRTTERKIYNVGPLLDSDPSFLGQMRALAMDFATQHPEVVPKLRTLS